jgi:PKD repeat protein
VLDPTATASLDGSLVCDDGNSSVSYLWTVDPAGPVIASDTSLITTATIAAAGSYTFTLTATDAAGDGTDTVTVNVYGGES